MSIRAIKLFNIEYEISVSVFSAFGRILNTLADISALYANVVTASLL